MLEYLLVAATPMICAIIYSASRNPIARGLCVAVSFVVLFSFLALRHAYGNDYWSYVDIFEYSSRLVSSPNSQIENGWLWFNFLLQPLGFRAMVVATALFYLVIIYRFVLKEVPRRYVWLSFFLLLVEPTNFLIHLSAMRQTAALVIFLIAVSALSLKRIYLYLALVCIASLFHRSVLAMIPLVLIALPEISGRLSMFMSGYRWMVFYLMVYLIVSFLLLSYGPTWLQFVQADVERYQSYKDVVEVGTGLGVAIQVMFFGMFIYYGLRSEGRVRIILYVCSATYLIIPLVIVNAAAARLMIYPQIAILAGLPIALTLERRKIVRLAIVILFCAWTCLAFIGFWNNDVFRPYYSEYQSVLSLW